MFYEPKLSWDIRCVAHSVDKPIRALGILYTTQYLCNQRYFRLKFHQ